METSLIPVFIPPLITLLVKAQKDKGAPLNREEVEAIRDNGVCMAVPPEAAHKLNEERGYCDINPQHAWRDYLDFLAQKDNDAV